MIPSGWGDNTPRARCRQGCTKKNMNWEQMKRNVGCHVQLEPTACRIDDNGRKLPAIDDDWIVEDVSPVGVRISNARTNHSIILGSDHIHHFTSDPERSRLGIPHGFLTLNVQIFLQGIKGWVRPNARPGEPVKPHVDEPVDKWVDLRYPHDSGLQQRLEAVGYRVAWCSDTKLSRKLDLEGWEVVTEPDAQGARTRFRVKGLPGDQTLIRTRATNEKQDKQVTNVKRCLECGEHLYLAERGVTTADTVWLCPNGNCPCNRRR
jgi:hypothetical protein